MGEYAIRKSDNQEIKIGTCEDMYYLRLEDLDKITPLPSSIDPIREIGSLRFRLPFPDEDHLQPGEYEPYNRGERLYCGNEDFTDPKTAEEPGLIQLTHKSGLLVNLPCYHGVKLPEIPGARGVFWNGKSHSFELYQLRPLREKDQLRVYPVVHCRHCWQAWRYKWDDLMEWIPKPLRERLAVYSHRTFLIKRKR